ncbi:MAG: hypothetical protein JNL57_03615 [Bacteroidetes bacterium]|nr:hypothetical protein [Bacteroidota bacterium]
MKISDLKSSLLFWLFFIQFFSLCAAHHAEFTLNSLEWNGLKRNYSTAKIFRSDFTTQSDLWVVDTINSKPLYGKFQWDPVLKSDGMEPAFSMVLWQDDDVHQTLVTRTRWVKGEYDAGASQREGPNYRAWKGSLRYTPDPEVNPSGPHLQEGACTFRIGSVKLVHGGKNMGQVRRNISWEGYTGKPTRKWQLKKYKGENLYLQGTPVRCIWGPEQWIEMNVQLFSQKGKEKPKVLLEYRFSSADPKVKPNYIAPNNSYEIRNRAGTVILLAWVQLAVY